VFERTCLRLSLLAALSFNGLSGSVHAAPDANASLAAPYASEASRQTVAEVLARFAADHGLTMSVGSGAANTWQTAKLDGYWSNDSTSIPLDRAKCAANRSRGW
jgi:hypothetical protein